MPKIHTQTPAKPLSNACKVTIPKGARVVKPFDSKRYLYRSLAEKHGMSYLPFLLEGVAGKPALNLPDGLHPNAAGYQVIAERVWPLLHSMLEMPDDKSAPCSVPFDGVNISSSSSNSTDEILR